MNLALRQPRNPLLWNHTMRLFFQIPLSVSLLVCRIIQQFLCRSCLLGLACLFQVNLLVFHSFWTFVCQNFYVRRIGLPVSAVPVENMNEKGRGNTKDHPLNQWFVNFSEADELSKLAAAREQVKRAQLLLILAIHLIESLWSALWFLYLLLYC